MSYNDMEMRWGPAFASLVLREIERAANLNRHSDEIDPEIRLQHAQRVQDGMRRLAA